MYGNYVWSKNPSNTRSLMVGDNPGPLDLYNLKLEKAVVELDRAHVGKVLVDWQLLFGRGGRAMALLAGGWSFSGIFNYSSGTPLGWGSFPLAGGWNGSTNRANVAGGEIMLRLRRARLS